MIINGVFRCVDELKIIPYAKSHKDYNVAPLILIGILLSPENLTDSTSFAGTDARIPVLKRIGG